MWFPLHSSKACQQGRLDGLILTIRPSTMNVLSVGAARQDVSESENAEQVRVGECICEHSPFDL